MTLLLYSLILHFVVSVLWVGRAIFDAVLFALPASAAPLEARLRLSRRWVRLTWILMGLVVATGLWNTVYNPISLGQKGPAVTYGQWADLRQTGYGLALFLKHGAVIGTVLLTAALDFYAGPRILAGEAHRAAWLPWLTRANAACVLAILVAVAYMVYTLH